MTCGDVVLVQVTLVAESYGGCLGLRVAAAAPELIQRVVLVNPATGFSRALFGVPSLIASSNLLSLFPAPLYQVLPVLNIIKCSALRGRRTVALVVAPEHTRPEASAQL